MSQTTTVFFLVQSDGPSFDGIFKTVTPTIAKEIVTLEKQRLSITLRYLATGSNFEDLKCIRVISKATGIVVLQTCLLLGRQTDRQSDCNSMDIAQYCPHTIQYSAQYIVSDC